MLVSPHNPRQTRRALHPPFVTARWSVIAAATTAAALLINASGLPTPSLFAALVVGIAYALLAGGSHQLTIPTIPITAAQALLGVALGSEMQAATLRAVAADWFGVSVVIVGTVGISLVAGLVFATLTGVDRRTGMLGLVAGGASAIIAMSDELGADGRLVAFMQYLRVLVVVLLAPLVAFLFLHDVGVSSHTLDQGSNIAVDLLFTAGCALAGTLFARLFRLTAGALLGPLIVAAAISVSGAISGAGVPEVLQYAAFAIIGLQVGLRFTFATIRQARRLLGPVVLALFALVAASSGLSLILVLLSDVPFADAYLATTPGGLYAVLAASIGIGADTTFIVSVQVLRVFVIVLAAPPLIRRLARGEPRLTAEEESSALLTSSPSRGAQN